MLQSLLNEQNKIQEDCCPGLAKVGSFYTQTEGGVVRMLAQHTLFGTGTTSKQARLPSGKPNPLNIVHKLSSLAHEYNQVLLTH